MNADRRGTFRGKKLVLRFLVTYLQCSLTLEILSRISQALFASVSSYGFEIIDLDPGNKAPTSS